MTTISTLNHILHPHHVTLTHNPRSIQNIVHQLSDRSDKIDPTIYRHGLNSPRFNIYETSTAYLLDGEFPGLQEKKQLIVEWLVNNVLIVRGTVLDPEMERADDQAEAAENDNENGDRVNMYKPPNQQRNSQASLKSPYVTPKTQSPVQNHSITPPPPPPQNSSQQQQHGLPYRTSQADELTWAYPRTILHERQIGEFQRSFTFPTEVEPNNMKATLVNGLLRVVLPKKQGLINGGVRRILVC